jgi:hypothetical protein
MIFLPIQKGKFIGRPQQQADALRCLGLTATACPDDPQSDQYYPAASFYHYGYTCHSLGRKEGPVHAVEVYTTPARIKAAIGGRRNNMSSSTV